MTIKRGERERDKRERERVDVQSAPCRGKAHTKQSSQAKPAATQLIGRVVQQNNEPPWQYCITVGQTTWLALRWFSRPWTCWSS